MSAEVVVIGAGIVGCSTAYELALRGVRVCLVDRGEVSSGTTGLGEGNVLTCDRPPGPELELALLGQAVYDDVDELLGAEAGIRRKGALIVHADPDSWAAEPARLAALHAVGLECELVDDPLEVEPELTGAIGASFFPRDSQCAPRAIARALAREAAALGAEIRTGVTVRGIAAAGGQRSDGDGAIVDDGGEPHVLGVETDAGPIAADAVVLAAGTWSAPLARSAGVELPVEPRKGQLVLLEQRPDFFRRKIVDGSYMGAVATSDDGLQTATVMETTVDGHVLVGSSRQRCGFDTTVDDAVSDMLVRKAARLAPGIARLRRVDAWAGLRPWLPGGLPAIGPSRAAAGLWIAAGHEGAGVTLGPVTGRVVAAAICGEPALLDMSPFDPDRYSMARRRPIA